MRALVRGLTSRLARPLVVASAAVSLGALLACTKPPQPLPPQAPAPVAGAPSSAVSLATVPVPAGPRCGPGSVSGDGPDGLRGRGIAVGMPATIGRRPPTVRRQLPPHVPFTFREAPAAEAPSLPAKLEASDWHELTQWLFRAVLASTHGSGVDTFGTVRPKPPTSVVAYLPFLPPKSPLRNASMRVALVKALGPAVRAIASSTWFAGYYARTRALELGGSDATAPAPTTAARVRASSLSKQCAYLDQLRAALATPGLAEPERVAIQAGIAATEAQIDRWRGDPTLAEEWAASEHAADVAKAVEQRQRAEERRTALAVSYPESPPAALLARLDALVDATADVDFSAKIVQRGRHKVFVDPGYEQKPVEWKAAYRLGKPTVDALRAFAADWRKELVAAAGAPMVKP